MWSGNRSLDVRVRHRLAARWRMASPATASIFVPLRCRSASSWTAHVAVGRALQVVEFQRGTRSECCHFISIWRELADLACFSIAKLEREVHDGKGI